jgi:hypothetical protein
MGGAPELQLDAVEGRQDVHCPPPDGEHLERRVDRRDLRLRAEHLTSGFEPLVVDVDGDAGHVVNDAPIPR